MLSPSFLDTCRYSIKFLSILYRMGTKRRVKKGSRSRRKQKLYKMKGCSRKRCVGGKKKSRAGRPSPHLFVTYTGGTDVAPVASQAPGGGPFGSQTGGCGCSSSNSTSFFGGGSQSGGCGGGQCSLQGGGQSGGADALVGGPWNPASPGQLPVPNHYALNTYSPVDISRQMIATGAQPPFSIGGGKRGRER